MQNMQNEERGKKKSKKKYCEKKDPKISIWNWKLSLVLLISKSIFHSFHSAVHFNNRSNRIFVNSAGFAKNAIEFGLSHLHSPNRPFSALPICVCAFFPVLCYFFVVQSFHPFSLWWQWSKQKFYIYIRRVLFFFPSSATISFLFSISNLQNAFVFNRFCLRFRVKYVWWMFGSWVG